MSSEDGFVDPASVAGNVVGAWVDASAHLVSGALRANRTLFSTLQGNDPGESDSDSGESGGGPPSLAYTEGDWATETDFETPGQVSVGDVVAFTKSFTADDVEAFAAATGDTNRLHLDEGFAAESRFGGTIVHGTLVSGLISAALARLPGNTIYLSQDLSFLNPVEIGEEVTAVCEVVEALGGSQFRLTTTVRSGDETVIDGEAIVLVDDHPET